MATPKFNLKTPHAAILIWNYQTRLGSDVTQTSTLNTQVIPTLISTVSCMNIETTKTKGSPVGSFKITLAPTKNWVAELTPGSWLSIMMSNNPITAAQIGKADPKFVKMFGRIHDVRVDVAVDGEGARHTTYVVTGQDWGEIFNYVLYIDNLLAAPNDPSGLGNNISLIIKDMIAKEGGNISWLYSTDLLVTLISLFGATTPTAAAAQQDTSRISKSVYDFNIPSGMAQYFGFVDANGVVNTQTTKLSELLTVESGKLIGYDTYDDTDPAIGFLEPYSLQGTNTLWQLMQDNNCHVMNELFVELDWAPSNKNVIGPQLTVFNRIKPFSYQAKTVDETTLPLRSPFNLIKTHTIPDDEVLSVNAGTNWTDKYNFVEVRPQINELNILGNLTAKKNQYADLSAFEREGLRPLILGTKQFPPAKQQTSANSDAQFDINFVSTWCSLLREWYFDTHKLLNGTITVYGTTEYIGCGNNIMFSSYLIAPSLNMNASDGPNNRILAHVESVSHSFTVDQRGSRSYRTTIKFTRGILVNNNRQLIGDGTIGSSVNSQQIAYKNALNNFGTSDANDPDPQKLKGNL